MRKALFIDRDGTINRDRGYTYKVSDLELYPDSIELIKRHNGEGYVVIVITNQAGIGKGIFTEEECMLFNNALITEMKHNDARIDYVYYCPHRPEDDCRCRKPNAGLVRMAAKDLDINLKESVVVGDRDEIEGELARRLSMDYMIIDRNAATED